MEGHIAIGIVYTVLGGMKAVIWTDLLQFFVLGYGYAWLLGRKQDPKKHVGLTLWTMNTDLIEE